MDTLPRKNNCLLEIFGVPVPIIGTIHCLPFPGAPRYDGNDVADVIAHATEEAEAYARGGVNGLIVENEWDIPFPRPEDIGMETVAMMTAVAQSIRQKVKLPLGVMILANAVKASLAVAKAVGASFVRVNQWVNAYVSNEGILNGESAQALRYRSRIYAKSVRIFADVHVKHGAHAIVADRPLTEQAGDVEFYDADTVIASGQRTGDPTNTDEIEAIRRGTTLPLLIGSGLTSGNAGDLLPFVDGAIVGSSLKFDGVWWNRVDVNRVRSLMQIVERVRAARGPN